MVSLRVVSKHEILCLFEKDGNLDNVDSEITSLVHSYGKEKSVWVDIEIDSGGYLQDLQQRIAQLTAESGLEVLLVRRSKHNHKNGCCNR